MEEKIFNLVSELFNINKNKITLESNEEDIEEWDSLGHLSLITAIEKEFNVKLSTIEILKIENIGDIISILNKKI